MKTMQRYIIIASSKFSFSVSRTQEYEPARKRQISAESMLPWKIIYKKYIQKLKMNAEVANHTSFELRKSNF